MFCIILWNYKNKLQKKKKKKNDFDPLRVDLEPYGSF